MAEKVPLKILPKFTIGSRNTTLHLYFQEAQNKEIEWAKNGQTHRVEPKYKDGAFISKFAELGRKDTYIDWNSPDYDKILTDIMEYLAKQNKAQLENGKPLMEYDGEQIKKDFDITFGELVAEINRKREKIEENEKEKAKDKGTGSSNSNDDRPPYKVFNGRIYKVAYKPNDEGEWVEKPDSISHNFYFEYLRDVKDLSGEVETEANIVIGEKKYPFKVDTKTTSRNELFEIAIKRATSDNAKFEPYDVMALRGAFNYLKDANIKKIEKVKMGWREDRYVMPSVIIDHDGIHDNNGELVVDCPVNSKAKHIDMKRITDEDFNVCGAHIIRDLMTLHDRYFVDMAIADAYGAPFISKFEEMNLDEIRYPKVDLGEPEQGKSYVEKLMQCHFGRFPEKNGFVTFGSTNYSVQAEGGNFKDVLFLVDDISKDLLSDNYVKKQFHELLHNYVSHSGRGTLSSSGNQKYRNAIEGSLVITAENKVMEGASNVGRVFRVDVPLIIKDVDKGALCQNMKQHYPGFMARYIAWIIKEKDWKEKYMDMFIKIRDEFIKEFDHKASIRAVKMHAIRYVSFNMFCNFMEAHGFMSDKNERLMVVRKRMLTEIGNTTEEIQNERHTTVLIDNLRQLLSTGRIAIAQKREKFVDNKTSKDICIVLDDEKEPDVAYIVPEIAIELLKEHMKKMNKKFEVNVDDIGRALKEAGWLYKTDGDRDRYRVQIRFNGGRPRLWCVKRELIGIHDVEKYTGVSAREIAMHSMAAFKSYGITMQPSYKQFAMVVNGLIEQFRPNLSREDKSVFWNSLVEEMKLVFAGACWYIPNDDTPTPTIVRSVDVSTPIESINAPMPEIKKLNNFDLASI